MSSSAPDSVPLRRFTDEASELLRDAADSGQPIVLTEDGQVTGIVLTPTEYERLSETLAFLESVLAGIDDAQAGRTLPIAALRERVSDHRSGHSSSHRPRDDAGASVPDRD